MRSDDTTEVTVLIVKETEKAVCVKESEEEGALEIWLPKSQIEIEKTGKTATLTMPTWLYEKSDLS